MNDNTISTRRARISAAGSNIVIISLARSLKKWAVLLTLNKRSMKEKVSGILKSIYELQCIDEGTDALLERQIDWTQLENCYQMLRDALINSAKEKQ